MVSASPDPAPTARQEWRAYWPAVVAGTAGMSFFAMITYQFGLFIGPLEREFGWDRASISFGMTIFTLGSMLLGPLVGALMDRIGTRRIGIVGLALASLAVGSLGFANGSLVQWYFLWLAVAVTAVTVKSTLWSAAVNSLFTTSRGLALAVVLSGTAIGQSLAPLIGNALIEDLGWRWAFRWMGLGWGGIALVLVLLFLRDARDLGRKAAATADSAPSPASLAGLTSAEAMRDSRILRIAIANLLLSMIGSGVSVHMVPILIQTGQTTAGAAGIAATAGLAGLAGKLVTGWLLDRVQGNLIPFTAYAIAALGYFLLMNRLDTALALTLGVMLLGYSSGAGLQVTAYLVSRYAGMRNFGTIYATIGSTMMLGTSLGPLIAGLIYDTTRSYDLLLTIAIPAAIACGLLFVGLGRYPDFAANSARPA
jgi:MFS family permease